MSSCNSLVIKVRDFTFHYSGDKSDLPVLDSVSLDISNGELVILTGASGSGKTTFLTLLGGLRTGGAGLLEVLGKNITFASTDELFELRKQVGFIFQSHNLLPYLTAAENIRVGLEVHDNWRKKGLNAIEYRSAQLLELLELSARGGFKPQDLSLGQRQRVSIARAIANDPMLILADEPTASLDKDSARIAINLLRQRADSKRCAIVVVTHDNKILDFADRIVNLENGSIA